ncbi:CBS domain-containing protein [Thauera sp. WB-2]|uniref:CBS domain-containing protein n=1 Tax=Thauera sp. WB-2 TaxID=2897772 RepID=UPI0022DE1DBF|nr:CBS domain-containing protein [Thauera sp. WB-2]WBL64132.1 CBS domain-containing protein [Thauera sp. WB-2]
MFSVYGITGRIFSGTLEAMDRVRPLARARSARAIAQDGEELGVEAVAAHPSQEAVRAYRAMLPEELERGPLIHAVQAMTRPAIAVRDHATAAEAWRILRDRHIRQAPVLDAADNLVGIVSERDLLTAIDLDDGEVIEHLRRRVRDVMTTPVAAAAPVTDIRRVAAAMLAGGVDGVPVVGEDGRLLGFVSRSDVLRAVINDPPLSLWR